MKRILVLFVIFCNLQTHAQDVAYSEPFEEIHGTWLDEMMLLNNGKTALISISERDGIEVSIYDKDHKLAVKAKTDNDAWIDKKLSSCQFEKIFQANNNIVILISQLKKGGMKFKPAFGMSAAYQVNNDMRGTRSLHRIVLSSETGKIISAEQISELATGDDFAKTPEGGILINDYHIATDPETESYAVLAFEGYTPGEEARIKATIYDKDNKLVKQAALGGEVSTQKFTHFDGMVMHNDDLFVCTNDFNPKSESFNMPFYVSVLKHDATSFTSRKIELSRINNTISNELYYNAGTDMLQMSTRTLMDKDVRNKFNGTSTVNYSYSVAITFIDAATLQLISSKQYTNVKANEYAKTKLGDITGYRGGPPSMYINCDNSTTLQSYEGNTIDNKSYDRQCAFTYLNKTGEELEAYVINIPEVSGSIYTRYAGGNAWDKYYLSTKNANYMLINDLPENFSISEKEIPHGVGTLSDANTIIYKMADGKITKSYLYGEPKSKRATKFTKFANTSYNKKLNTLSVLMVDNDRGDKVSQIAWIAF